MFEMEEPIGLDYLIITAEEAERYTEKWMST